ncbi:DUF6415 family natural product biosynthesis protein [Streptacidiphilus sp. EB103A]|uniref:DUF6415 family natural product biosynthesis protein n=1 Tax=Streptacidiphilus sp. EB103A TaxID=3156275 RepID=UPI003511F100
MLDRLRSWTPFDADALLDDIAVALGEVTPATSEVARLLHRLRSALPQLVGIAVASGACRKVEYVAVLVRRARAVTEQPDTGTALGLRQAGWCCHELLDQLVAGGYIKGVPP